MEEITFPHRHLNLKPLAVSRRHETSQLLSNTILYEALYEAFQYDNCKMY